MQAMAQEVSALHAAGGWTWQRALLRACLGLTFLPWPPLMAVFCLQWWFAFFFNSYKTYVARIAVCMRNGHPMNNINQFNHTLHGWFQLYWTIVIPGLPSDDAVTIYCHRPSSSPVLPAPLSSSVTRCMVGCVCEMESQPERAVPVPAWLTTPRCPCRRT